MTTPEQCRSSLVNFEKSFHTEVFKWIEWKMSDHKNPLEIEILDISVDYCVFTNLLKNSMNAKRLVTAIRGDQSTDLIEKSVEQVKINGLSEADLPKMTSLGTYDIIILHDVVHEAENLLEMFLTLKKMLKSDESRIFVLARPKNPPPPIPDVAVPFWRKLAPNRDELIKAVRSAGMGQVCYSVSCPVRVAKQDWHNMLKLRPFHAMRLCPKCTDKEIRDYASGLRPFVLFEEKILLLLITPRPEQGDIVQREEEPTEVDPSVKFVIGHQPAPQAGEIKGQPEKPEDDGFHSKKPEAAMAGAVVKPRIAAKTSLNITLP